MLQETEIAKLISEVEKYELPPWQKTYMARIAKDLQVHTKGLLFSKVDTLFPHEHPDSKAHCVNTYEPFTKGSIWKAINNLIRIFSNSSFAVSASDSTLDFLNKANFCGENLFSFFIKNWNSTAIATDPNALCAVYPEEYIKDFPGDRVRFINSEHSLKVNNDIVAFISEAESTKSYELEEVIFKREVFFDPKIQGPNQRTHVEHTYNQRVVCKFTEKVYHVFTKEYLLRFMTGSDGKISYSIYDYKKPQSAIAAFKLTSVPLQTDINESFVAPFIPFGNLSLLQHRNHRAVDLTFSYPRMSEIETPCDALNCVDGHIPSEKNPSETVSCAVCRGSGFITVQSPYKVYKKKIDTGLTDPDLMKAVLNADPVTFHTPDASILTYSKDSWKEYLSMAEEAVFIQQKVDTGNVESAKKTELDKEGEYSWVLNVSKALNTDLKKVIQAAEDSLNSSPVPVSIEQPLSFAILTETEAFEQLDAIISGNAPIFIKANKVENFVHKFISKSSPIVKALNILKTIDPLLFYSTLDLQMFKSNSVITVEAWITHVYAYSILMSLYQKDKLLFEDKEEEAIAKMVTDEIVKIKPAADLKTSLLNSAA